MDDLDRSFLAGAKNFIELCKAKDRGDGDGVDTNLRQISESYGRCVDKDLPIGTLDKFTNACITGARDLIELAFARDRGEVDGEVANLDQIIGSLGDLYPGASDDKDDG